ALVWESLPESGPTFAFPDPAQPGQDVYVYTRSVYGAYRFLGELLNLGKQDSLSELPPTDIRFRPAPVTEGTRILNLTHDHFGCWTSFEYEHVHWDVPKNA